MTEKTGTLSDAYLYRMLTKGYSVNVPLSKKSREKLCFT